MQNEHLGFWSLPIFFQTEKIFSYLIELLLKENSGKPSSKTFPVGTTDNISFLTSTIVVVTQQMSKIQSRLVVKPKQKSFNQSAQFIKLFVRPPHFRVPYDLNGVSHF